MVNHPNRSIAPYRFIAWSTITQAPVAHAATLEEALALARLHLHPDFTEVLACGNYGRAAWSDSRLADRPLRLFEARRIHPTAFAGATHPEHTIDTLTWPAKEPTAP